MKFVRILRDGTPIWGVIEGENVHTLSAAPVETVQYDGRTLPLKD